MSITATVHITHDRIALAPTLHALEDVRIETIEQGTTNPGERSFPFLVKYDDSEVLEAALEEDPTVREFALVDWTGDSGIYHIEHTDETKLISPVVTDANGFLVHTWTSNGGWLVQLLLPDREALTEIWEYADEEGIGLEIIEIYGSQGAEGEPGYGLTSEQEAALQVAFQEGYFAEPRDTSLEEVAEIMDLSSTATSGRLRRGMRNLIAATIADVEAEGY